MFITLNKKLAIKYVFLASVLQGSIFLLKLFQELNMSFNMDNLHDSIVEAFRKNYVQVLLLFVSFDDIFYGIETLETCCLDNNDNDLVSQKFSIVSQKTTSVNVE